MSFFLLSGSWLRKALHFTFLSIRKPTRYSYYYYYFYHHCYHPLPSTSTTITTCFTPCTNNLNTTNTNKPSSLSACRHPPSPGQTNRQQLGCEGGDAARCSGNRDSRGLPAEDTHWHDLLVWVGSKPILLVWVGSNSILLVWVGSKPILGSIAPSVRLLKKSLSWKCLGFLQTTL